MSVKIPMEWNPNLRPPKATNASPTTAPPDDATGGVWSRSALEGAGVLRWPLELYCFHIDDKHTSKKKMLKRGGMTEVEIRLDVGFLLQTMYASGGNWIQGVSRIHSKICFTQEEQRAEQQESGVITWIFSIILATLHCSFFGEFLLVHGGSLGSYILYESSPNAYP